MKILNIIEQGLDFGTLRSQNHFFSFILKSLLYIIPAIILGKFTDNTIKSIIENKYFGNNNIIYYILLQTLIILSTFYIFILLLKSYSNEFQLSIPGIFFIVLYFGTQVNYINMINEIFIHLHK